MLESATFEQSFYDLKDQSLFNGASPIVLLGKEFKINHGNSIEDVKEYVTSRLWFTYRKNFAPIGGVGATSDQGWGCMMRCAQMIMGESLLRRHIGSHFEWKRQWTPELEEIREKYEKILKMFQDDKNALYSIHQIAQMSVSEEKLMGEWIGPNTAGQVLKKLAVFDLWSNVAVHVAMDNMLVTDDVRLMATTRPNEDAIKIILEDGHLELDGDAYSVQSAEVPEWRPLLIIIPLRLGLTSMNEDYLSSIQQYFRLPQAVGILGGRPNHALYFIGIKEDKLIYLDPHVTQHSLVPAANGSKLEGYDDGFDGEDGSVSPCAEVKADDEDRMDDSTFHCPHVMWMNFKDVDPSLALGFFCQNEADFTELVSELKKNVLTDDKFSLFAQLDKRPHLYPEFVPYMGVRAQIRMAEFLDMGAPNYESDDQFELLE